MKTNLITFLVILLQLQVTGQGLNELEIVKRAHQLYVDSLISNYVAFENDIVLIEDANIVEKDILKRIKDRDDFRIVNNMSLFLDNHLNQKNFLFIEPAILRFDDTCVIIEFYLNRIFSRREGLFKKEIIFHILPIETSQTTISDAPNILERNYYKRFYFFYDCINDRWKFESTYTWSLNE